jgi:hypothetical protein
MPPLQLAGGAHPSTVFSHLAAEHTHARGVLGFLTTRDACSLRVVCHELLLATRAFRWADTRTSIRGPVSLWRASFPHARAANVSGRADLIDGDFIHLAGVGVVFCMSCVGLTDAAFAHLTSCHTLDMSHCNQSGITNAGFAHLGAVRALNMSGCNQAGITDAAFRFLPELRSLGISQSTFGLFPRLHLTDRAFTSLVNLESLCASGLDSISDASFKGLVRLKSLSIAHCDQAAITEAGFADLAQLQMLDVRNCNQLTDAVLSPLTNLRSLDMRGCDRISAACVGSLAARLDSLFIADCSESVRAAATAVRGARVFL